MPKVGVTESLICTVPVVIFMCQGSAEGFVRNIARLSSTIRDCKSTKVFPVATVLSNKASWVHPATEMTIDSMQTERMGSLFEAAQAIRW